MKRSPLESRSILSALFDLFILFWAAVGALWAFGLGALFGFLASILRRRNPLRHARWSFFRIRDFLVGLLEAGSFSHARLTRLPKKLLLRLRDAIWRRIFLSRDRHL